MIAIRFVNERKVEHSLVFAQPEDMPSVKFYRKRDSGRGSHQYYLAAIEGSPFPWRFFSLHFMFLFPFIVVASAAGGVGAILGSIPFGILIAAPLVFLTLYPPLRDHGKSLEIRLILEYLNPEEAPK